MTKLKSVPNISIVADEDVAEEFRQRFGSLRLEAKLTLRELSEISGITLAQLGSFATGNRFPSVMNLRRLAQALGTSVDYLLALVD